MVEHDMQLVTDLTNRIVVSWRRFGFRSTSSIDIVDTAERRAAENHAAVRWFCEKHRRVR